MDQKEWPHDEDDFDIQEEIELLKKDIKDPYFIDSRNRNLEMLKEFKKRRKNKKISYAYHNNKGWRSKKRKRDDDDDDNNNKRVNPAASYKPSPGIWSGLGFKYIRGNFR